MTGFLILAALLLLAAYAFFMPVLMGRRSASGVDRQKLNLELHKQRKAELSAEFTGEELEKLQAELDKDLLGDLAATGQPGQKEPGKGRGLLIIGLVAAPLLGMVLYAMLGRFDLADFSAEPVAQQKIAPEIQAMIDRLAERLKQSPGDIKGWLLLGRSYSQTEQYDQAVDAYAHALKLDPENLDIKSSYAEALGESMGGNYSGEPAKVALEILAKDPKHKHALWLAGAGAAQAGETAKAIGYLETLRGEFPKGSPDDEHIGKLIAQVKGEAEQAGAPQEPATGEPGKSIKVKVSLSAALKSKAAPEDMVFIFAKAASGPPMPLAIVRKQVKDLPVEVTLDDSMSMVQGMNLSAFDKLVIGARISKTGQALPKPGDLQGLTQPQEIEDGKTYSVEIGEEVK